MYISMVGIVFIEYLFLLKAGRGSEFYSHHNSSCLIRYFFYPVNGNNSSGQDPNQSNWLPFYTHFAHSNKIVCLEVMVLYATSVKSRHRCCHSKSYKSNPRQYRNCLESHKLLIFITHLILSAFIYLKPVYPKILKD